MQGALQLGSKHTKELELKSVLFIKQSKRGKKDGTYPRIRGESSRTYREEPRSTLRFKAYKSDTRHLKAELTLK